MEKRKKPTVKKRKKPIKDLNDPRRDTRMVTDDGQLPMVLTGYATATISANGAILKLEVRDSTEVLQVLQVAMSRRQCTELSEVLKRLAVLPYRPDQQAN